MNTHTHLVKASIVTPPMQGPPADAVGAMPQMHDSSPLASTRSPASPRPPCAAPPTAAANALPHVPHGRSEHGTDCAAARPAGMGMCTHLHTVYMDGNISIQVLIRGKTPPAHINKHSPRPLPTDLKLMRFCFLPLPPIPCLPVSTFTAPPAAT
eukprot:1157225-Pelagomonas_calceolata.AAC.1